MLNWSIADHTALVSVGVIAYKHTGDDVTTVTAAFDRIVINHPLTEICDLELSGMVTYATGRSSMEISLQVAKAPVEGETAKPEDVMITCQCTMESSNAALLSLGTCAHGCTGVAGPSHEETGQH
jgi:hypothetical protein